MSLTPEANIPADSAPRLRLFSVESGLLVLMILLSTAYFYNGAWHNQNCRLNAIFSFVEPGPDRLTFRMDQFMTDPDGGINTYDWSYHGGHYYPNKAPGTMILGSVCYGIIYAVERSLGVEPAAPVSAFINAYLINLGVTVIPVAMSAALFFQLCLSLTRGRRVLALVVTLSLYLGTMMFPYATQLWGHATVAALTVVVLYGFLRDDLRGFALAGFAAGCMVLFEYMSGLFVIITAGVLAAHFLSALRLKTNDGSRILGVRARRLLVFAAGGLPGFMAFLLYHRLVFGAWTTTAIAFQNPRFSDPDLFLGTLGMFSVRALLNLTILPFRGLFFQMPVLLLAIPGLLYWLWQGRRRLTGWICALVPVAYICVLSAFNAWHGGATTGPRYVIAILPCLALGLAHLPVRRNWLIALVVLATLSWLSMLSVTAVSPLASDSATVDANPAWRRVAYFIKGELTLGDSLPIRDFGPEITPEMERYGVFNLGELLGLRRHLSLGPWLLCFAVLLFLLVHRLRQDDEDVGQGLSESDRDDV